MRMPPPRVLLRWALLLAAIVLAGATFAGYAGRWRYLEVCSDYRPYYLFNALFVLILSLGLAQLDVHQPAIAWSIGLAAVTIAINTFEVAPWIQSGLLRLGHAPSQSGLRIVSFNIQHGDASTAGTLSYLRALHADLVVLQESQGVGPVASRELENEYPHHLQLENLTMEIFNRHPLPTPQQHSFGPRRGFAVLDLNPAGFHLSVLAAHACPRHDLGAQGFAARTEMLQEGLPLTVSRLPGPAIVVGDLNASMWSPAYKALTRRAHLLNARRGFGLLNSSHGTSLLTTWLWRPIDHCLHTADLFPVGIKTGPDLGADHLPVVIDFDLGPSGRKR